MHIEFLVEEPSAEAALSNLIPIILGPEHTFQIHPFQGKSDLLAKLPGRLRGYSRWLPDDWRIVVMIDRDEDDCVELKHSMEQAAISAGLTTRSALGAGSRVHVLNRLAIEELEAWFFGDIEALCSVYPGVNVNLARQSRYRDPDAITGGTWESLERVLQRAGYYPTGIAKIAVARAVSEYMIPERNRSHSFQVFRIGLNDLVK